MRSAAPQAWERWLDELREWTGMSFGKAVKHHVVAMDTGTKKLEKARPVPVNDVPRGRNDRRRLEVFWPVFSSRQNCACAQNLP